MKRRIALAALLLLAAPGPVWADPVHFPYAPETGATWRITQTRSITYSNPAKTSSTSVVKATLKVIEASDEGYLMEWTTNTIKVGSTVFGANGPMPEMLLGVPVRFNADVYGEPRELYDFEALVATTLNMVSDGKPLDPAQQARMDKFLSSVDRSSLASTFLKESAIIASCLNFKLEPDEVFEEQVDLPNLLGGPAILTDVVVKLEDAGSDKRPARISIKQTLNPESASDSLAATAEKLTGERQSRPSPATIHHNRSQTCYVDTKTGEPVRIESDEFTGTGKDTKRDVRKFTIQRQ